MKSGASGVATRVGAIEGDPLVELVEPHEGRRVVEVADVQLRPTLEASPHARAHQHTCPAVHRANAATENVRAAARKVGALSQPFRAAPWKSRRARRRHIAIAVPTIIRPGSHPPSRPDRGRCCACRAAPGASALVIESSWCTAADGKHHGVDACAPSPSGAPACPDAWIHTACPRRRSSVGPS